MKTYKVDLDYEASLFDPHYREDSPESQKIIREFEYVFFLVEKTQCCLKNFKNYEIKYLDHLKALGFTIPFFNPEASSFEYWWGSHQDKTLEEALNSKITSAQIAKKNNWGFSEGAIVTNLEELKDHLKKFPSINKWMLKGPHSFSGIGHNQFEASSFQEDKINRLLVGELLLEPVYERVFDIGTTFEMENGIILRQFMVENFNSLAGRFKGGAASSNVDKFKKYIAQKYSFSLDELEVNCKKIVEEYRKLGAVSNLQIDSFVYRQDGKLKLYSLVEVNYRKTMGLVIQSLADKYRDADWIEWKIESNKSLKANPNSSEWIKISPEGNHFQSFFKAYDSVDKDLK